MVGDQRRDARMTVPVGATATLPGVEDAVVRECSEMSPDGLGRHFVVGEF